MEQWRDVPGYEGLYQISIDTKEGRCRRARTGRILKNVYSKTSKYLQWGLRKNGKLIVRQIARWIAITFPELIENEYFEGAEIDHKDTDRLNNQPNNLRWVTRKENINNPLTKLHQCQAQRKVNRHPHSEETKKKMSESRKGKFNNPKKSKPVSQYTLEGTYITTYQSRKEAERITGIDNAKISNCCLGKRKTAGGYIWLQA